ncbi:MAG TPA: NUDIX domain-containing protein [Bacteroidales bacterium]|nr:NUDIX domain-containing protein [Bacteroidales bacterium]
MTEVRFYEPSFIPEAKLTYSVIAARHEGQWVFVRHHLRTTTEIPGGHIEPGESSHEAACRELMEETGAVLYSIECVATYSVTMKGETGWGRLYFAEVTELGPVPDISEIAEVTFADHFLEPNTHPEIQPRLFEKVVEYLEAGRK